MSPVYTETGWGGDHGETARMLDIAPSWRQHAGKEPHQTEAIWFSTHDHTHFLNHPVNQIPNVYVDITDTIELKVQACESTTLWATGGEDRSDGLFRRINGQVGFEAGVEYAEGYERPWLRKETVAHLTT